MAPESPKTQDGLASSVEAMPKGPGLERLDRAAREETNVRVVARFRPPIREEEEKDQPAFAVHAGDNSDAIDWGVAENATVQSHDGKWSFEFDTAFSEEANQEVVYQRIGLPAVQDVLTGYNGTLLMYGQTGSGKTFSLFGRLTEHESRGLAPRAALELVQQCSSSASEESSIQCSFLEIYREKMRDLLNPSNQSLRIKDMPHRGLMVDGLIQEEIGSSADILKALDTGNAWRSVAATRQNQYSSRSHTIFTLYVSRRNLSDLRERTAKLSLVDLAGSERVSRSHCVGETLEEAKKINASLTALGKVIDALVERRTHIPYRDSMLTRVLEEALGGNSRTTLLVTASACSQYLDETVCSLRFAARAQKVRNSAHVNFVYSSDELWPLVAQLQKDLAQARRELHASKWLLPRRSSISSVSTKLSVGERRSSVCSELESKEELILQAPKSTTSAPDASWSTNISRLSTISAESPRSESSPSAPSDLRCLEDEEATPMLRPLGPASWGRPAPGSAAAGSAEDVLQVALETVRNMEQALLAQEEALDKAKLLRPEGDIDAKDKIQVCPKHCGEGDAWPSSWRLLRSQVEGHSLRWRLQRERCRSEGLQQELEIRSHRNADLQRQLEAAHAELALLKSAGAAPSAPAGAGPLASSGRSSVGPASPRKRAVMKSKVVRMQSTPALHTDGMDSPRQGDQLRASREAQCALRGENLELKQELAQKEQQMAALSADVAALRLRVSAKSHEAHVKDALLRCLQKEAWQPSEQCDEELDKFLAAVATPLLGALRHQMPPGGGCATPLPPSHFSSMCVLPGMPAPWHTAERCGARNSA